MIETGMKLNQFGDLSEKFGNVPLPKTGYYYHESAMANMLSLGLLADEFTVRMNTDIDATPPDVVLRRVDGLFASRPFFLLLTKTTNIHIAYIFVYILVKK